MPSICDDRSMVAKQTQRPVLGTFQKGRGGGWSSPETMLSWMVTSLPRVKVHGGASQPETLNDEMVAVLPVLVPRGKQRNKKQPRRTQHEISEHSGQPTT